MNFKTTVVDLFLKDEKIKSKPEKWVYLKKKLHENKKTKNARSKTNILKDLFSSRHTKCKRGGDKEDK